MCAKEMNKIRTKIISAFPGTGKSHYCNLHPDTTLDSDSSEFSWTYVNGERIRNPDFPANYIEHIKNSIGKYEYIFVSSHKEVREALKDSCLFYYTVIPLIYHKEEYLRRYRVRGNDEAFVNLIDKHWNLWIEIIQEESFDYGRVVIVLMNDDQYIDEAIKQILIREEIVKFRIKHREEEFAE